MLDVGTTAVVGAVIPGGGAGIAVESQIEKDAVKGAAQLLEEKAGQAGASGAAGGPRAGKNFTRAIKREGEAQNASTHGGQTTCMNCQKPTVPSQKSTASVTPPGNETQHDHIIPKVKNGNGSLDNHQLLCRSCNRTKGTK